MNEQIELKSIRKLLPHGTVLKIAEKAGVTAGTVSRALHGDKRSPKLPEIIKATAGFLAEHKARELEAMQALNQALKPEPGKNVNAKPIL